MPCEPPSLPGSHLALRPMKLADTAAWYSQPPMPQAVEPTSGVVKKCRFQREGRLRNHRVVRGEPRDYRLYATLPGHRGKVSL